MNGLSLVIQAGGEARRMGRDKALVPFQGLPLIQRVLERLRSLADDIWVTTNRPADYQFLGVPLAPDIFPGSGALGGLCTALDAARHPLVAVVACDMPFASAALLAYEGQLLLDSPAGLAAPRPEGFYEPFHTVYRREICLPLARQALLSGERRAYAWFEQAAPRFLFSAELQRFDPHGLALCNVNTPDELAQAETLAAQGF